MEEAGDSCRSGDGAQFGGYYKTLNDLAEEEGTQRTQRIISRDKSKVEPQESVANCS